MKPILYRYFLALALSLTFMSLQTTAQMGGGRGQGRMMGGPFYNAGTEMTVSGVVDDVQLITGQPMNPAGQTWMCPRGWTGTHLMLKTDTGNLVVHVGPSAFLASKNFSVAKGDKLTILGSKVQYQGSDFLIAKQITKGSEVLTLRDANGFPLWSGFRRGTPLPPAPAQ